MSVYNVGLKSLKVGDFDPATGAISNLVEIEVYKDTMQYSEQPGTQTKHFQAGKKAPKRIHTEPGEETLSFSIMNTAADSLLQCLGGTVTTVAGVKSWHKPKDSAGEVIKAIEAESLDGAIFKIPRGSWQGVKNFNGTETNIWLMDITVTPTDTGLPEVADFSLTDPQP